MLSKHELPVALADTELCYALPYMWARVREQSDKVQEYLLSVQETFKKTLIDNARHFAEACNDFYSNYDKVQYNCDVKTPFVQIKLSLHEKCPLVPHF